MEIIQKIRAGFDYPEKLRGNPQFLKNIETVTRRRLELRPNDVVTVIEV